MGLVSLENKKREKKNYTLPEDWKNINNISWDVAIQLGALIPLKLNETA